MKNIIKYALENAYQEVINEIDSIDGCREVKNGDGVTEWQADTIGLCADIGEALSKILGEDIKFICTGGTSTIFYKKQQLDVNTHPAYNRRYAEITKKKQDQNIQRMEGN